MNVNFEHSVTFGVCTLGRETLVPCLLSVLTGQVLPRNIVIVFLGPLPGFGSFLLEQVFSLARTFGVSVNVYVTTSRGIREDRDFLLGVCPKSSEYLWMGDDDAVYQHDCLMEFQTAKNGIIRSKDIQNAVFCGVKVDCSNIRKYPDYNTDVYTSFPAPGSALNHFYSVDSRSVPMGTNKVPLAMDCGNVLLPIRAIMQEPQVKFACFEASEPTAGGEDSVFAHLLSLRGFPVYAVPHAEAHHLEKPAVFFNEMSARKELIARSVELLRHKQ